MPIIIFFFFKYTRITFFHQQKINFILYTYSFTRFRGFHWIIWNQLLNYSGYVPLFFFLSSLEIVSNEGVRTWLSHEIIYLFISCYIQVRDIHVFRESRVSWERGVSHTTVFRALSRLICQEHYFLERLRINLKQHLKR